MSLSPALLEVGMAIAEVIRAKGAEGIPSGHLYAQVMGKLDLDTYNTIIASLRRVRLVSLENHVLTWIGPEVKAAPSTVK